MKSIYFLTIFTIVIFLSCNMLTPKVVNYDEVSIQILNPSAGDTLTDSIPVIVQIAPYDESVFFSFSNKFPGNIKPTLVENMTATFKSFIYFPESSGTYAIKVYALRYTGGGQSSYTNYRILDSNTINIHIRPIIKRINIGQHNDVYGIIEDSTGKVWISTQEGMYSTNGTHQDKIESRSSFFGTKPRRFAVDSKGLIWADSMWQCYSSGCSIKVFVSNGINRIRTFNHPVCFTYNGIIGFDRNGNYLEIETDGYSGMFIIENDSIKAKDIHDIYQKNPLYSRTRKKMAFDFQNRLWVTTNNGVAFLDKVDCGFFDSTNTDWPGSDANDIKIDAIGRIWVQFATHIAYYENEHWKTYMLAPTNSTITAMAIDQNFDVWLLMYWYGSTIIKVKEGRIVKGFSGGGAYEGTILISSRGVVVAGCNSGLFLINEHGFPFYN